jgi:pimeloyl-ACP methyl ester carboxylesterase
MTPEEWHGFVMRRPDKSPGSKLEYDTLDEAIHAEGLTPVGRREAERVMLASLERGENGKLRRRVHPDAFAEMHRGIARDPIGTFGNFGGPVLLLVAGSYDLHTDAGVGARRSELKYRLTFATISNSGHALMWHQFDETARRIADFLDAQDLQERGQHLPSDDLRANL